MNLLQADQIAQILGTMLQAKGIVGYKIARNLRMINEELKEYNEIKMELFKKYGTQEGDKLLINKDSENYPLYFEEIKPYEQQEINFDFRKFTEEELENSDLTAEQMYFLSEYFMEE